MTSAVVEKCARCGGVLGAFRIVVGGEVFHTRCSHDARDHRIEALELALHRIAGHGNITGDKAREIAAEALGIKKPE